MANFAKGCRVPADLERRVARSVQMKGQSYQGQELPASYDCRDKGLVTPIKDQKSCGNCWDFSGVTAAESSLIVAGKLDNTQSLSEQSVLDCGSNGGCNGDWPETALEQAKNSGLAFYSDYPYEGGPSGSCKNVPHNNFIDDYGYVDATLGNNGVPPVNEIKAAMMQYGPISIAVAADDAFQNYQPGTVFTDSGSTEIDHAVVLIGWKDDATVPGGGYWILRNSWNTSWGNAGYMNIAYGANQVGYGAMWAKALSVIPTPPTPPGSVARVATVTVKTPSKTITVPKGLFGTAKVTIPGDTITVPGQDAPVIS